jgi:hypothetical protein
MQLLQYSLLTFVVAFMIQYWVLSIVTSARPQNTVGKFYLSVVAASIMGFLEVMIYDTYKSVVSLTYYLCFGFLIYVFLYMYKKQIGIDDADYLKQMLESHSCEMEMSQTAVDKTANNQVKMVANNVVMRRKRDMDVIEKMLDDERWRKG